MSKNAANLLLGLILALGLNHLVIGMFWLPTYTNPVPVLIAFGLYLAALLTSLYAHKAMRISRIQAYANLVISLVVPVLVLNALPIAEYSVDGSYQTWFVAGISLVLAITSGRGYPILAWVGIAILWTEVITWGGAHVITTSGLIGALILVTAAWAVGRGVRLATEAAESYHLQASELKSKTARNVAAREARQRMLQATLLSGKPLLELIRDQDGNVSDAARSELVLVESRFRDEIQGYKILNDGIRIATRDARKRGVDVAFNDEGGLNDLSASEVQAIQQSVIQAIESTLSGKIYISAPMNESYAVSIVATRPEAAAPDLWLRLP
jgi:hypothetical protein